MDGPGDGHGFAPNVVVELATPHHPGRQGAGVDADIEAEPHAMLGAEPLHHLQHGQGQLHRALLVVDPRHRKAADRQIVGAGAAQLLDAAAFSGIIEGADQFVEHHDRLVGLQFGRKVLEAFEIGVEHADARILLGDRLFALLEPFCRAGRQDVEQQPVVLLQLGADRLLPLLQGGGHAVEGAGKLAKFIGRIHLHLHSAIAGNDLLGGSYQALNRLDETARQRQGHQGKQGDQDGAQQQQGIAQLAHPLQRFGLIHLGHQSPLKVANPDRLKRLQHPLAAVIDLLHFTGLAGERPPCPLGFHLLNKNGSIGPLNRINLLLRKSLRTKGLEVLIRGLQKRPEGRAQLEILAHQKSLTSFAKPLLLPLLVIGHHPIDRLRIQLIDQGTDKFIAIKNGGADKKGRLTEAGLVALHIRNINKIGIS